MESHLTTHALRAISSSGVSDVLPEPLFLHPPQSSCSPITSVRDFKRRLRIGVVGIVDFLDELGRVTRRADCTVGAVRFGRSPRFFIQTATDCASLKIPGRRVSRLDGPSATMLWKDSGSYRFTFTDESDTINPKALERRLYLPKTAFELDSIWYSLEELRPALPEAAECKVFKPGPTDGVTFGFIGDPLLERYASFVAGVSSGPSEITNDADLGDYWGVLAETVFDHQGDGARLRAQLRAERLRQEWLEERKVSRIDPFAVRSWA